MVSDRTSLRSGRIGFRQSVAAVGHGKASVSRSGNFYPTHARVAVDVDEIRLGGVILFARILRVVKLPDVFDTGRSTNRVQRLGTPTLGRSIVHNRDPRLERVDYRGRVREIQPMMGREIEIHA